MKIHVFPCGCKVHPVLYYNSVGEVQQHCSEHRFLGLWLFGDMETALSTNSMERLYFSECPAGDDNCPLCCEGQDEDSQ
ncbi:hypothetical protein UFOVP75_185 [uncultured Caudovirales phage]|uniref:Uncharacterized protein n=1 Tax=uncultured Caudovirales phage TaxID=2100421 RepID=A0A6J5L1B1_9CAUD|nr:hypothetical protein UFOVP75_185 [uncultured Caudovirales phage]